ncbi:hypothetical protein C5167_016546 [Papaver somniferum]|nr:hypothetical protein C5167_016546 [Papaver somniferum]
MKFRFPLKPNESSREETPAVFAAIDQICRSEPTSLQGEKNTNSRSLINQEAGAVGIMGFELRSTMWSFKTISQLRIQGRKGVTMIGGCSRQGNGTEMGCLQWIFVDVKVKWWT